MPLSQPPVRLDRDRSYSDLGEWLDLSIERILTFLGSAAAIEIFSSVYSTLDPWDALRHRDVFDAIERLCGEPRRRYADREHHAMLFREPPRRTRRDLRDGPFGSVFGSL